MYICIDVIAAWDVQSINIKLNPDLLSITTYLKSKPKTLGINLTKRKSVPHRRYSLKEKKLIYSQFFRGKDDYWEKPAIQHRSLCSINGRRTGNLCICSEISSEHNPVYWFSPCPFWIGASIHAAQLEYSLNYIQKMADGNIMQPPDAYGCRNLHFEPNLLEVQWLLLWSEM